MIFDWSALVALGMVCITVLLIHARYLRHKEIMAGRRNEE